MSQKQVEMEVKTLIFILTLQKYQFLICKIHSIVCNIICMFTGAFQYHKDIG